MSRLKNISSFYATPAWPDESDPPFVNAAAQIETDLSPEALMAALHAIEAGFGRRRSKRNAPRTLDLDLLAFHQERRDGGGGGLALPHPRLSERAFVLVPVVEIAPDWVSPASGNTAAAMLDALGPHQVRKIT